MHEESGLSLSAANGSGEPAVVWLSVVVPTPAHSGVAAVLSYRHTGPLPDGQLVRVPLGRREVLGLVWGVLDGPPPGLEPAQARDVSSVLDALPPLGASWRRLVAFAARYYQRSLGEVALGALPAALRDLNATQLQRRLQRTAPAASERAAQAAPVPSPEQAAALAALHTADTPVLLFGSTGSGKTEVYLRAAQALLCADDSAQVLVLVPEINLTPQLQARLVERLGPWLGPAGLACLHSGMTPPQRLVAWLAAHSGRSRVVLGTRLAIFASLPQLRLIVVDEEHDPSYKSQEGARYSARDLAVYRARLETERLQASGAIGRCQVVLGSATPSLESWHAAEQGRYQRLAMPSRVGGGGLPGLRLVDMNLQTKGTVLSPQLMAAIEARVARGEQSLVLLNRRGYAPVLSCGACDWKSQCPHCSAYRVFHKVDRTLRCHHCGLTDRVPRACPDCGNLDIAPVGRGTEQLEEQLAGLLADVHRPDGTPVKVARMDADSTRAKGALEAQLAALHSGEVDVLVGTQMVAKGHDFRRITLVASVNADAALFASDYRAPERLFALLMQASGRAGRDSQRAEHSEMWVQTWHPQHPLFAALRAHDYPGFAAAELAEREAAGMPPFGAQALVRADARSQAAAQAFLNTAAHWASELPEVEGVALYPAVPTPIARVANVERAQLLVECASRPALQRFLAAWQPLLLQARSAPEAKGLIRFAVDVDPLAI
jgi:primosomal protein N' (replication factor Y) (superfamily II helicase)